MRSPSSNDPAAAVSDRVQLSFSSEITAATAEELRGCLLELQPPGRLPGCVVTGLSAWHRPRPHTRPAGKPSHHNPRLQPSVSEGAAPRMPEHPQPTPTVILARDGETVLHVIVVGDLDARSVNRLREHIERTLTQRHPASIELDLDGVPFLDASAAIQLRRLHHQVADAGSRLSITTAQPFTWWLLNAFTLTSSAPPHGGRRLQPEPGS